MQNLDSATMTLFLVVLLLTVLLLSLVLVVILSLKLSKSGQNSQGLLTSLLLAEQNRTQSLLNQLRSQDPQTLSALQYATEVSKSDDEYTPSYDEGVIYQENINQSGYTTVEAPDEFNAGGWDPVTVRNSGGSPVNFEQDS